VLDSSATLAWYFEDELTDALRALLKKIANSSAVAPSLWRFEVANGLQMAVRRKRIDAAYRDKSLINLAALPIHIDAECDSQVWTATVRLATNHGLTVYDAAYPELAQRRRLPLATLDMALAAAAKAAAVPLALS